jgi:hypothetical protein
MGVLLLDADKLATQYIGPLGLLEHNTLMQLSMQSQPGKFIKQVLSLYSVYIRGGRGGMGEGVGRLLAV